MYDVYFLLVQKGIPVAQVGFTLTLLFAGGAVGKSAQLPLQTWLPDAMEGPTSVSTLIHSATMVKAGVYLVARMYPAFSLSHDAMTVVAYTGVITAVMAAFWGTVAMMGVILLQKGKPWRGRLKQLVSSLENGALGAIQVGLSGAIRSGKPPESQARSIPVSCPVIHGNSGSPYMKIVAIGAPPPGWIPSEKAPARLNSRYSALEGRARAGTAFSGMKG
jgi:hypothetical protein